MALTIKMRIDEQPEHSYVFSTDGGQIELIPLSVIQNGNYSAPDGKAYNLVSVNVPVTILDELNITENGTYTAEDGHAYDVVTVNIEPLLEIVSRSITENGTYVIDPSEGYDGIERATITVNVSGGGGGGSNDFIPASGYRSVTPLNFNQNKLNTAYVGKIITFTTNDTIAVGDKVIIEGDLMSGSDKKHHYAVWGTVTAYNATSTVTTITVEGSSVRFYSVTKTNFTNNTSDYGVLGFTSMGVNVHPWSFGPVQDPNDPYSFADGRVDVEESQMASLLTDPTNTRLYYMGSGERASSGDKILMEGCDVKSNGDTIGYITIWGTYGACEPYDYPPYFVFARVDGYTYEALDGSSKITKLAHACSVTNGEQVVEYV